MDIDTRLPAAADITEDQATMSYLQNGKFPEEADRKEQNRIRKRALNFEIRAGKLFKRKDQSFGERPVPAIQERLPIVARMHQIGHPGVDRLRTMVNQQYYWPGIGALAKAVKDNCADCQRASKETVIPQGVKPIPVYGVLQRWHVDLIGPFPTTVNGNKYGIVAIDSVSKWPEAGALPNKTADWVKHWFWETIICRYGTPQEVITDNGSEFKGEFGLMLQRCDITHLHTSPHHPQANGLVERMNQTIKNSMKREVNSLRNNWDEKLPLTLLGIRASRQATIKMAPAEALLGHKIRLPVIAEAKIQEDKTLDNEAPDSRIAQDQEVQAHIHHMENVEAVAFRNIDRAADRVREYTTRQALKRKTLDEPSGGDLIMIGDFSKAGLTPHWEPNAYRCKGYNESRTQIIVMDATGRQWFETIEHVKPYNLSPEFTDTGGPGPSGLGGN